MMRSESRRFGARFRPRFRIRTWCRIKMDSATTERSPPGRPSRIMMTMACRKRVKMSRMLRIVSNGKSSRIHGAFGIRHPQARAHAVSSEVEAHNVYLPEAAPWVRDFVEECAAFPAGAHDDQVDAMTQALTRLRRRSVFRLSDGVRFGTPRPPQLRLEPGWINKIF